jgi:hypothetical protein
VTFANSNDALLAPITNGVLDSRKGGKRLLPLAANRILKNFQTRTENWPRKCGEALFVVEGGTVSWLRSPAALFGWASRRFGVVPWHRGTGFLNKDEFFEEVRRTALKYQSIESLPHVPPIEGHFYVHPCPDAQSDGRALDELLRRFSPETQIDADLIRAMFATLVWGGEPGTRPAFVITAKKGRGVGKTKLAAMVGHVAGGILDFSAKEDIGTIKQRLLSPAAATARVCLLDNVKSLRLSWAELESLITSPLISGKRMYVGEASRPNTLLWLVTLNGASLSTDMAQRAVIINLAPPERSAAWEEETVTFIRENRAEIVNDLAAFYRLPADQLDHFSRWSSWERDVLARLAEPAEAQAVIRERQAEADAEQEGCTLIEEFFEAKLVDLGYAIDIDRVHIPVAIAAKWTNLALNDNQGTASVSRMLNNLCTEDKLSRISRDRSRTHGRGFLWCGIHSDPSCTVRSDLETRLEVRQTRSGKYAY